MRNPLTSTILAFGVYLLANSFAGTVNLYKGGENQTDRFSKILAGTLRIRSQELVKSGILLDGIAIGTHSFRKGASTYASNGTTDGPSITAICMRAGWTLGNVQDRYIRFEKAGDCYLGRVLSGLPLHTAEFALLPPYFIQVDLARVHMPRLFPTLYDDATTSENSASCKIDPNILLYCLASVVYHSKFLADQLPKSHILFQSLLFREPSLLQELQEIVVCYHGRQSNGLCPSGVSLSTSILKQVSDINSQVEVMAGKIVEGVGDIIEAKGVQVGNITAGFLRETLLGVINEVLPKESTGAKDANQTESDLNLLSPYVWRNGTFRRLPEDFMMPKCNIETGLSLCLLGNRAAKLIPFSKLSPDDFNLLAQRKRFSDWKTLLNRLIDFVESKEPVMKSLTIHEKAARYTKRALENGFLPIASSKKRRINAITVTTALNF